jgi:hypothetical protein
MSSTPTSNAIAKVEFVCRNCKEGGHGCPGYWTGLGLEIWCTCTCVAKADRRAKENILVDNEDRQSVSCLASKLEETGK